MFLTASSSIGKQGNQRLRKSSSKCLQETMSQAQEILKHQEDKKVYFQKATLFLQKNLSFGKLCL